MLSRVLSVLVYCETKNYSLHTQKNTALRTYRIKSTHKKQTRKRLVWYLVMYFLLPLFRDKTCFASNAHHATL